MKKYLVIAFLCLFAFSSFAASKTAAAAKTATAPGNIYAFVSRDAVLGFLNESNTIFIKGEKNGQPATAIKYLSVMAVVKNWLKLCFLEVDTEIDISWYNKVFAYLNYMAKAKQFLDTAGMNGKAGTAEYKEVAAKLDEVQKRFGEAIKNPTPVNEKKLAKLRDEKRKWESEKRREEGGKG